MGDVGSQIFTTKTCAIVTRNCGLNVCNWYATQANLFDLFVCPGPIVWHYMYRAIWVGPKFSFMLQKFIGSESFRCISHAQCMWLSVVIGDFMWKPQKRQKHKPPQLSISPVYYRVKWTKGHIVAIGQTPKGTLEAPKDTVPFCINIICLARTLVVVVLYIGPMVSTYSEYNYSLTGTNKQLGALQNWVTQWISRAFVWYTSYIQW